MKRACLVCLFLCLTTPLVMAQSNPASTVNRSGAMSIGDVTHLDAGSLFSPAQNYNSWGLAGTDGPNSVAVGDVNGDSKPDLVAVRRMGP